MSGKPSQRSGSSGAGSHGLAAQVLEAEPSAPDAADSTACDPAVLDLCTAARAAGHTQLSEPEGLEIARRLGFRTPRLLVVGDAAEAAAADLASLPGERVVVKVISRTLTHKSDAGGVEVVAKERRAVAVAIDAMAERVGDAAAGFGIYEWIGHDAGLGGELLLGLRWSDAFGPVVALGPGGLDAEALAAAGLAPALLSPLLDDPGGRRALLAGHPFTARLTRPHRGAPPRATPEALAGAVGRLLALARVCAGNSAACGLLEYEINPLVFTPDGTPVALDAVARLGTPPQPAPPRPLASLRRLLHPASVAVVGVSERLNPGRRILRNLLAAGFDREALWVVKPGRGDVDGCPRVGSLEELPQPVDLLVLAVAAQQAPGLVATAVARSRAASVVLIPGGLGETADSAGRAADLRRALARGRERSAAAGAPSSPWDAPVLNGGNCLGVRSVPGRVDTLFIPPHKLAFPAGEPAPVAVLSQSGAFAIARASQLARLNPRYLVTTGNQLDLTVADYLEYLADDPALRVFACYVEGFPVGDGGRFVATAARLTAAGRTVLLYAAGRTVEGAAASASHTASVAGDPRITRELARQAGVLVADSVADFDDLLQLAWRLDGRRPRRPTGPLRLAAVSNAGFECVAMADRLDGLRLAPFTDTTRADLAGLLRRHRLEGIVEVHNPLDLTPMADDAAYEEAVRTLLADDEVDLAVVGCVPLTGALATAPRPATGVASSDEDPDAAAEPAENPVAADAVGPRLVRLWRQSRKPWVMVVDSGPLYDPLAHLLANAGLPVFRTADRAVRLLAQWAEAV
jgi:acyl-CoA synthetase (NDP forming)